MNEQRSAIECGRCGEAKLDLLTDDESKRIDDGVGPIYRLCERCETTTGWIARREDSTLELPCSSTYALSGGSSRPIPQGQERLASQSELEEMNDLLRTLQERRSGKVY